MGVSQVATGFYSGKGKNQTFTGTDSFLAGDTVIIRVMVTDENSPPVSNATVEIQIGGPEQVLLNSNPSDADGWAEEEPLQALIQPR